MFEEQGKNVVLNKNSVEGKPCINKESKSDELKIQLCSCPDINMEFLVVVTEPSIYQITSMLDRKLECTKESRTYDFQTNKVEKTQSTFDNVENKNEETVNARDGETVSTCKGSFNIY